MENQDFSISSRAFQHEGRIPPKYTCDGDGINPPLQFHNIPSGTVSLAMIVDDPDAPNGTYDHWIVWNIDPVSEIPEGIQPGISGNNSDGKTGFHPPCPPDGEHRYFFYAYALDARLHLEAGADRNSLEDAIQGHILGNAELMGRYTKQSEQ
jgi:Raf kinase inhibitor-like YbhB/YbcL family protein